MAPHRAQDAPTLLTLTERDEALLEVLARHVRVLSLPQVARTWWPEAAPETARARLRTLAAAGVLHLTEHLARAEVPLARPLGVWACRSDYPRKLS